MIYFKATLLQEQGVAYAPLGLAIIKARRCAKFMLVGRVFHIGKIARLTGPLRLLGYRLIEAKKLLIRHFR